MSQRVDLIILGASARAAAFSALRAGLQPWCADLFADVDLRAHCAAVRLGGAYPDGFSELLATAPAAPWLYTGGLENHPRLVARLAQLRTLWGNDAAALTAVRDPLIVQHLLCAAGLAAPRCVRQHRAALGTGRWLLKPLRGAGGVGIRFHTGEESDALLSRSYLQEYLEGESRSALYVAGARETRLLGMTRQLIGATWLHAAPFQYCGSVGPLALDVRERAALGRLGEVLATGCGLRGLFGVDGVWRDGTFWPVEVNPRYSASIEVLEYATGLTALAWHRSAFDSSAPVPPEPAAAIFGKAILFARAAMTFPATGPWQSSSGWGTPAFADVPECGQQIEARRPVLTYFARADDLESCQDALQKTAEELDRQFAACGLASPC